MNLDEFKAHVLATRQASKSEALSVPHDSLALLTKRKKENK